MQVIKQIFPQLYLIFRFIVSGGLAAIVNLALLYVFTEWLGVWYLISSGASFLVALVVSFTLQKFWTFRNLALDRVHLQAPAYALVAIINLLINIGLMYLLVEYTGLWYMLAQVIAGLLIAVSSFFIYSKIIFKK